MRKIHIFYVHTAYVRSYHWVFQIILQRRRCQANDGDDANAAAADDDDRIHTRIVRRIYEEIGTVDIKPVGGHSAFTSIQAIL